MAPMWKMTNMIYEKTTNDNKKGVKFQFLTVKQKRHQAKWVMITLGMPQINHFQELF